MNAGSNNEDKLLDELRDMAFHLIDALDSANNLEYRFEDLTKAYWRWKISQEKE